MGHSLHHHVLTNISMPHLSLLLAFYYCLLELFCVNLWARSLYGGLRPSHAQTILFFCLINLNYMRKRTRREFFVLFIVHACPSSLGNIYLITMNPREKWLKCFTTPTHGDNVTSDAIRFNLNIFCRNSKGNFNFFWRVGVVTTRRYYFGNS